MAQTIGYIKIDAPAISTKNVFISTDEFAQLQKTKTIGNKLSVAVFFYNAKGTNSETPDQTAICNGIEQALLGSYEVKDRKIVTQKLQDNLELLSTDFQDLDFVLVLSGLSFEKTYKVNQGYVKKALSFLTQNKYELKNLGQEYFFKGITLTGKFIRAKNNSLLGSFTFDYVPCISEQGCPFLMIKGANGPLLGNVNNKQILGQEISNAANFDDFIKVVSTTISKALKQSAR